MFNGLIFWPKRTEVTGGERALGRVVPKHNYTPRYEDIGRNGGVDPLIPKFGARWKWMVSFTLRQLYFGEKACRSRRVRGWLSSRTCFDASENRKSLAIGNQTMISRSLSPNPSHCTDWTAVGRSSTGGWRGQTLRYAWKRREMHTNFGRKIWRKVTTYKT
jgi:hypothetical protein